MDTSNGNARLTKLETRVEQHRDDIRDIEEEVKDLREASAVHKNTLAVLQVEVKGIANKLESHGKVSKEQFIEMKQTNKEQYDKFFAANKKTNMIIIGAALAIILETFVVKFIG